LNFPAIASPQTGEKTNAMDGLPQNFPLDYTALDERQRTLKSSIGCIGVALHTGQRVSLTFRPAPPDHGIVFRRTDLGLDIPARFDCVTDTRLATVLSHENDPAARVSTVEHVMAALAGCGIDNALVELDGPEPPILDGSAAPFVFLIDCAGIADQPAPRRMIEVRRAVRVTDGDAFAELRPSRGGFRGLDLAISIDFPARAIGRQALSLRLTPDSFRQDLARARTFVMAQEVEQVRAAGLGRGGSLDNAVVVDRADVLNPSGLRMADEFVRHKMLDAVGDLALAGAALRGRFLAHRSGHALNNRLLQALFADAATWHVVATEPLAA
jgi:UDP-3-O-[3-hydroxymyristoyl] N-acetylglucosamine deacetylase